MCFSKFNREQISKIRVVCVGTIFMNLMFPDRRIYEISVGDYVEGRKGFNVWVMFGETHPYWRDPEDREEEILHIRTGEIPFVVWRGISYDVLKTDDGLGYLLSEPKAVSVS